MLITNRQRLNYILDWLAEPFPERALLKSCACGTAQSDSTPQFTEDDRFPSKRELFEASLLEALKMQSSPEDQAVLKAKSLKDALDTIPDAKIGPLLVSMPLELVDRHLNDLALFSDPNRPTNLEEIKQWDQRHANDFLLLNS